MGHWGLHCFNLPGLVASRHRAYTTAVAHSDLVGSESKSRTLIQEISVASVCDVCRKTPGFGMSVSHSHRRTHRRWNPNIQSVRTRENGGNRKRLNVCTSCLKAGKVTRA